MQRHKDHGGINKAHFEELMTIMLIQRLMLMLMLMFDLEYNVDIDRNCFLLIVDVDIGIDVIKAC